MVEPESPPDGLPSDAAPPDVLLADEDRAGLLRHMLLMRVIEERGISLYKQGRIPGSFYDGRGQEAISVGATWAMSAADPVCSPLIRDLGAHLVRGTCISDIFRHYMGRENPISRGREGNVHFGDRRKGVVGMVSMLPDMVVVAVGLAMAFQMRDEERCALTFFGDGATSRGDWHEAMNWAGLNRLAVVLVFENNGFAYSTPSHQQFAIDPAIRAAGYGIEAFRVDGNDVEAVFAAAHHARRRALAGEGPTLIEAMTMRMHGHGAHDDAQYVPADLREHWAQRDPIARYTATLQARGVDTSAIADEVAGTVAAAVDEALKTPMADPSHATEGVYCENEPESLGEGAAPWSGFSPALALPA
jgi:pyruvate dehydrogenase E1 component alpha subunit